METNLSDYFEQHNPNTVKDYCDQLLKDGIVDFASIIELAHKLTLMDAEMKSSNYKQRNFMAEVMFGNYVGLLYDNYAELMQTDDEKRPYLRLADDVRVYPKKLNEKYLPSNVVTGHVKKLNGQELFEDGSKIHVLYSGYILTDSIWPNALKGNYISCVNTYFHSKLEWVLDLEEYRKSRIIGLPIHILQIEERLASAKRNLPLTGEGGL